MKKRVLFLCVGNACRSQMAEGFARAYGSDVIDPCSAGLGPAGAVPEQTIQTMQEKNIDLSAAYPKGVDGIEREGLDLIVNLTGNRLPSAIRTPVQDWDVRDPIGESDKIYRQVRDEIEGRVMRLILALRAENNGGEGDDPEPGGGLAPAREGTRSKFDILRGRFRQ